MTQRHHARAACKPRRDLHLLYTPTTLTAMAEVVIALSRMRRAFRQAPGGSTDVMTVTSYAKLHEFVAAFASGHLNLLILIGDPGLAKTRIVKSALGDSVCWIEGNCTPFGMYQELYRERSRRFVVIDDVDSLYSDRVGVRLLKALCQTEPEKTVAWHSSARSLEKHGIPTTFQTSAKVIIISNDWRTLNRNVSALQDRGFVLLFAPTAEEVHREAGRWFRDEAVYQWFGEHLHLIREPSLRLYVRAAMLKNARMDWTAVLPIRCPNPKERLVAELQADERYPSQEARAREFSARGGGCRRTYFNYAKRLRNRDSCF